MNTPDDRTAVNQPSSRNGRYWLRASREVNQQATSATSMPEGFETIRQDAAHGLPFQAKQKKLPSGLPFHESVLVAIPNVATDAVTTAESDIQAVEVTESLADFVAKEVDSLHLIEEPVDEKIDPPVSFDEPQAATEPATEPAATPSPVETSFSTSEPLTAPAIDDAVNASRSLQRENERSAIGRIVDQIVEQFPLASPSTVLFVGSEDSMHIDETCARVAAELAARDVGRVLLVDSDFENKRLTVASGMAENAGLSEIMNVALPWKDAVLSSGSSKLDFLPAGTYANRRWNPDELLRDALADMKSQYQMICVSGGDAHGVASKSWSQLCDGSYLVVSVRNSNDRVAESAAIRLRQMGARLIGCIVTDVAP